MDVGTLMMIFMIVRMVNYECVYFVMNRMSTVVSNVIGMYEDGYTTIQIATELKLPIITVENIVSCIWDYEDFA